MNLPVRRVETGSRSLPRRTEAVAVPAQGVLLSIVAISPNTPPDNPIALPALLSGISDAIWAVTPHGTVSYWNESAREFHRSRFGSDVTGGVDVLALYPGDARPVWADRYRTAASGETVYALEAVTTTDGEQSVEIVLEPSISSQEDPEIGRRAVVVIARPLTGRHRTVGGTTLEARAIIDSDTYVLFANPRFRALIGLAASTPIRSLRLRDLVDPDDLPVFLRALVPRGEERYELNRLRISDLTETVHQTTGAVARSPDSGHFVLALLDITHQVEAEIRLEQNAQHLQALHALAADLNSYIERPDLLYRRALELLGGTVRFDSASVQMLYGQELRIVACAGFANRDQILGLQFPFDGAFPNWKVVTSRQTVSVGDVGEAYPHFRERADEFGSGDICSWLGVPLAVREEVLGMVSLDRHDCEAFTPDDIRLASTMIGHIAVALHNSQLFHALQASEAQLTESNRQKEVLLRELHHRSKNNMQMISSLLSLGAAAVSVEEDGQLLDEVRIRIQSLAAVHEELYRAENLDKVDLADYARRVAGMVADSYGRPGIGLRLEPQPVSATVDVSVPFGLILSELVLNAYKHAFPNGQRGVIIVSLIAEGDTVHLTVSDDGPGMTIEQWQESADSLGMQLVSSLVDQLGGSIDLADGPGTTWLITFPVGGRGG